MIRAITSSSSASPVSKSALHFLDYIEILPVWKNFLQGVFSASSATRVAESTRAMANFQREKLYFLVVSGFLSD